MECSQSSLAKLGHGQLGLTIYSRNKSPRWHTWYIFIQSGQAASEDDSAAFWEESTGGMEVNVG